jgi:hypothetical protein
MVDVEGMATDFRPLKHVRLDVTMMLWMCVTCPWLLGRVMQRFHRGSTTQRVGSARYSLMVDVEGMTIDLIPGKPARLSVMMMCVTCRWIWGCVSHTFHRGSITQPVASARCSLMVDVEGMATDFRPLKHVRLDVTMMLWMCVTCPWLLGRVRH